MSNNNIHKMVARVFAAMLMTAAVVSPAAAQKKKINFDGATTSGFNAMDYRLQKPLGNPTFPEDQKGFGKNFFIGFNAGGVLIGNNFSGKLNGGGTLGIRMGSWFTPVHGIRIGADAGKNTLGKDLGNTWFKGLHAEYLLNVTNLMRGYNPERRFELIGTLGAQLQRNKYNDIWGTNYGITTSLQARFNVQPSMYLYVEPQLAVLGGAKYNSPETVNRLHANLALNVGIGYRILTGRERIKGARIFEQKDDDNMFFGLGGGLFGVLNLNPKIKNSHIRAFGGKMFSSTSGLQFAIDHSYYTTGTYTNDVGHYNQHIIMGSVNYDLNLNNAFGGYRPTDVFQMILNVGPTVATVTGVAPHKFHFGVQAGLMGLFRLSSNWGIYVHPQVYGFTKSFYEYIDHKPGVPLLSVDLGLRYTIGNNSRKHGDTHDAYDENPNHWFVTAGGGAFRNLHGGYDNGGNGFIGIGKRFTPVSSWRVNIDGAFGGGKNSMDSYTLHADYLLSLTTSMCGYNPDRFFDLQAMVGVFGGVAKYSGPHKGTYGLEAGLQANFRVNKMFDIFLEPQALAIRRSAYKSMVWTPDARLEIGLRYKLKL